MAAPNDEPHRRATVVTPDRAAMKAYNEVYRRYREAADWIARA
jgi:hypothetical protein